MVGYFGKILLAAIIAMLIACSGSSEEKPLVAQQLVGEVLLNGPVENSDVSVYDVALGYDEAIFSTQTSADVDVVARVGKIGIPKREIISNHLYLIVVNASGSGEDIDADVNNERDDTGTGIAGKMHAIISGEQIIKGGWSVNPLTEVIYQKLRYLLGHQEASSAILEQLDPLARAVLDDIDGLCPNVNDCVDYNDVLAFKPGEHRGKLLRSLATLDAIRLHIVLDRPLTFLEANNGDYAQNPLADDETLNNTSLILKRRLDLNELAVDFADPLVTTLSTPEYTRVLKITRIDPFQQQRVLLLLYGSAAGFAIVDVTEAAVPRYLVSDSLSGSPVVGAHVEADKLVVATADYLLVYTIPEVVDEEFLLSFGDRETYSVGSLPFGSMLGSGGDYELAVMSSFIQPFSVRSNADGYSLVALTGSAIAALGAIKDAKIVSVSGQNDHLYVLSGANIYVYELTITRLSGNVTGISFSLVDTVAVGANSKFLTALSTSDNLLVANGTTLYQIDTSAPGSPSLSAITSAPFTGIRTQGELAVGGEERDSDPTFLRFIDYSTPSAPNVLSRRLQVTYEDYEIHGDHVYVQPERGGLQIYDVNALASPIDAVAVFDWSQVFMVAEPLNKDAKLFVSGSTAVLTSRWLGNSSVSYVLDYSDFSNLNAEGPITPALTAVNGDFAYVHDNCDLYSLPLADLNATPTLIGGITCTPMFVQVLNNKLYMAGEAGVDYNYHTMLEVYDLISGASPPAGYLADSGSTTVELVRGGATDGNELLLHWADDSSANYIFDISSGASAYMANDITGDLINNGQFGPPTLGTAIYDGQFYISDWDRDIYVYESQGEGDTPAFNGEYLQFTYPNRLVVENDVLYVADGYSGVFMFNLSNAAKPRKIANFRLDDEIVDIVPTDNYLLALSTSKLYFLPVNLQSPP